MKFLQSNEKRKHEFVAQKIFSLDTQDYETLDNSQIDTMKVTST